MHPDSGEFGCREIFVSNETEIVRVELAERSYDIRIGDGNLPDAGSFLLEQGRATHAVVLTDSNVEDPHGHAVAESLSAQEINVDMIVVEPGEPTKSVEAAATLWDTILDMGADRRSVVVAVGGGVVGDLAGFIAATFARGVRFFQVPTSLLAQVDSSVGGKVGINLPKAKNMVGAFLQPIGVLIDTRTLDTLDGREYRAGLAEVVKYGVILDAAFFGQLEAEIGRLNAGDHDLLRDVIAQCCRLKADVVRQDERETSGLRAMLNYGHTFGHAFEALAGYGEVLHGEGVSIGMLCASRLAERLGRIDSEVTERQEKLLVTLGLPTEVPNIDPDLILKTMMHDKKVEHGRLRFVLPSRLGHVELVGDVDPKDVLASLRK
jgi:3-dehydroquinate synthase